MITRIYPIRTNATTLPDGVYRAGFATAQGAYESAVNDVFNALDRVEKLLDGKDYLVGDRLTEADIRLWVTIVSITLLSIDGFKESFSAIRSVSTPFTLVTLNVTYEPFGVDILPLTCEGVYFVIIHDFVTHTE